MLYGVPFEAEHVFKLDLQDAQKWILDYLKIENIKPLENIWAATLMKDGKPVACVGPIIFWPNRALIWSYISKSLTRPEFLEMHNMAKKYLDGLPFKRLEAAVEVGFEAGHRWIKAFGFEVEAPRMRAFQIDGKDCTLYARVIK